MTTKITQITPKQRDLILQLDEETGMLKHLYAGSTAELSKEQASQLIDQLKAVKAQRKSAADPQPGKVEINHAALGMAFKMAVKEVVLPADSYKTAAEQLPHRTAWYYRQYMACRKHVIRQLERGGSP